MQKILVLAALPDRLRLDKESREIEDAIKRAVKRDLFEIRIRTAVRPQDIRRALAEERPQIVHFCGHGMEDGSLVLEDDGGNHKCVLPAGLASLFNSDLAPNRISLGLVKNSAIKLHKFYWLFSVK